MKLTTVEAFSILGIAIRTTNEDDASAKDIPALWARFFAENIIEQLPGKISNDLYCVYTDYEKDFTRPYTALLGCRVTDTTPAPAGFTKKILQAGQYQVHTATGRLDDGIVFKEWTNIWNSDIQRSYTTDFEVYGEKAQNPADAAVDIFIAVE